MNVRAISYSEDTLLQHIFRHVALTFFPLLLLCFLSPVGGDVDVMFRVEHSTAPYSQHVDRAKVSALTVALLQ